MVQSPDTDQTLDVGFVNLHYSGQGICYNSNLDLSLILIIEMLIIEISNNRNVETSKQPYNGKMEAKYEENLIFWISSDSESKKGFLPVLQPLNY